MVIDYFLLHDEVNNTSTTYVVRAIYTVLLPANYLVKRGAIIVSQFCSDITYLIFSKIFLTIFFQHFWIYSKLFQCRSSQRIFKCLALWYKVDQITSLSCQNMLVCTFTTYHVLIDKNEWSGTKTFMITDHDGKDRISKYGKICFLYNWYTMWDLTILPISVLRHLILPWDWII